MIAIAEKKHECPWCGEVSGVVISRVKQHMIRFDKDVCPEYTYPVCKCTKDGTVFSLEPTDGFTPITKTRGPNTQVRGCRANGIASIDEAELEAGVSRRVSKNIQSTLSMTSWEGRTKQRDMCLLGVWEYRGRTVGELANLLKVKKSSVYWALYGFLKKGLVCNGESRICLVSKRNVKTWFPVEQVEQRGNTSRKVS